MTFFKTFGLAALALTIALLAGCERGSSADDSNEDRGAHDEHVKHDEHDEHRDHDDSHGDHEGEEPSGTRISAHAAEAAGIRVEPAGPHTLSRLVHLTGTVEIDPSRVSMVRPRFPGLVTEVFRNVGDEVERGDRLASVETNEGLMTVPLTAPIIGLILERAAQPGQVSGDEPLFVIADPRQVWVQLDVFGDQVGTIEAGQPVDIETLGGEVITAEIDWVSPVMAHGSQSLKARVIVPNADMALRPGQFVKALVHIEDFEVPLAVRIPAIQRYRDADAVFVKNGDTYEARPVQLGRRDAQYAEVLDGLEPARPTSSRTAT